MDRVKMLKTLNNREMNSLNLILEFAKPRFVDKVKKFSLDKNCVWIEKGHVRGISLSGQRTKSQQLKTFFAQLSLFSELESLHLYFNNLQVIPPVTNNSSLISLGLSGNNIESIDQIAGLKALEELMLGNNRIEKIQGLYDLPSLKKLNLSKNKISTIENLDGLPSLSVLDLSDNHLSKMEGLESLINLRELYMDGNRIRKIQNLYGNPRLETLSLEDNFIEKIENIEHLNKLEFLELRGNPLKEEYVEYDQFPTQFWVSRNKIEKRGIATKVPILSFIGFSNSGKTAIIECLISFFSSKNVKIIALKHIHIDNFSIDKPGKNTWRFSKAGASSVVAQSENESAVIFNWQLDPLDIINMVHHASLNYGVVGESQFCLALLEGFREMGTKKILCASDYRDVEKQIDPSIVCVAGSIFSNDADLERARRKFDIPFVDLLNKPELIYELLKKIYPSHDFKQIGQ